LDPEVKVASNKDILKNLDSIIREATLSSFDEFLSPLLEDERKKQDDMSKRTKQLDASDKSEDIDEGEDGEEDEGKEKAVAAATGKKAEEDPEAVVPSAEDIANADVEHIVNMLNMLRSGKSTKDKEVQKDLADYFEGLDAGEKQALYIMMSGLTQIMTADVPGDEAPDPTSVGIKIQAKKKDRDAEVSQPAQKAAAAADPKKDSGAPSAKPSKDDSDLPIQIGEVADKSKVRARYRLLGRK